MGKTIKIFLISLLLAYPGSACTPSQTVIEKTSYALDNIKSYQLDSNVKNDYQPASAALKKIEWTSSRLINLTSQQMHANITVNEAAEGSSLVMTGDIYIKDRMEYLK